MKCPRCQADNPPANRYCAGCGTSLTSAPGTASSLRTQTLVPSPDPFSTGTLFAGRYRIIEELGRGGMGQVYKAIDTKIQERIAIKIIRPEIADNPKTIERFRNELKLARQISHRNVCRMHDLGEDGRTHFITMEYVSGENLDKIIRRMKALNIGTAEDYARQICEGLAEAHRLGVVHRDLKPQNIIIDETGTVRIMDFGIARTFASGGPTGEGMMIGTPDYMAPEQAEGKTADQRTDIYAFGLILYEMVAGKRPFDSDTPISVAMKHKTEIPRPPRDWNAQVPDELNALILKCLEKDKTKRYQSASELLAELGRIEVLLPRPREDGQPARSRTVPAVRKRLLIAALGVLAGLAFIAVIGYVLQHKTSEMTSLAILPFKDLSREQNQGVFCEGISDDIRSRLSSIEKLNVISKFSSDQYKNTAKGLKEIGRELDVRKTLSGTLEIENNVIQVRIELGDTRSEFTSWSKTYKDTLDGYFKVEAQIAGAIAQELSVRLAPRDVQQAKGREPANLNAYMELRWGTHFLTNYRNLRTEEDFFEAVKRFGKTIELDPACVPAYWGLGDAYEARFVRTADPADQAAMERYYRRAYEINSRLPESAMGMGWIYFHREDPDKAFGFFRQAVEADPNNPLVDYGVGSFLRSIGLYESALRHYQRAIELDPLSYRAYMTGISCYSYIGEFEKAEALAKQAVDIEPNIPRTHAIYARQLLLVKRYDEAEQELIRAEKIMAAEPQELRLKAWLAAVHGDKKLALDLIDNIAKMKEPLYTYEITNAYCLLGKTDEVIKLIREGIDIGFHTARDYLYSYPYLATNFYFDTLRNDPRFREILASEKIKYDEKLAKFGNL
jgi:eukaryotic-like serine/threonine-protein kinase